MRYRSCLYDLLKTLAAFAAAQTFGYMLMYLLRGLFSGYWYNIVLNSVCVLGANAAAFLLICGRVKLSKKQDNFKQWELAAFFFGAVFLACIAGYLAKLLSPHEIASGAPQGYDLILYAIYTLILAPVAEEIAFRGAALSRLRNSFGPYISALLSAILFAAYHMSLAQFPYTFVLGFCLAIVAQRGGNIICCILLHALNNLLTLAAALSDTVSAITDIALPILGTAGIVMIIVTKRYKIDSKTD